MDAEGKPGRAPEPSRSAVDPPLKVSVRQEGPIHVVRVRGAMHIDEGEVLTQRLRELISPAANHLILDLSELVFVGSAGLSAFVAAHNQARKHGGSVRIVSPRPPILRLLRVARIDRVIPVHATIDDARNSLG